MDCARDELVRPGLLRRVVCSAGGEADADSGAGSFYARGRCARVHGHQVSFVLLRIIVVLGPSVSGQLPRRPEWAPTSGVLFRVFLLHFGAGRGRTEPGVVHFLPR
jgi:hypothetical protein